MGRASQRKQPKQLELGRGTWGGRREGAGRKPKGDKAGVKHATRTAVPKGACLHVTLRTQPGVAKLRTRKVWAAVRESVRRVNEREDFRVCELAVGNDRLQLILEASDRDALTSGMNALCTSLARRINNALGRTGKLFGDRYDARILKTASDVRNALASVLDDARREPAPGGQTIDEPWLAPPRTKRLRELWRDHGLLDVDAVPG